MCSLLARVSLWARRPRGLGAQKREMLRRQARQRREYLHLKAAESKEHATYDRKRKVKEAVEQGKALPTELRKEEAELRKQIEYDDEGTLIEQKRVRNQHSTRAVLFD